MWLSQSALDRIRELEALLRDSVPQGVYQGALARIAELERQVTDLHALYQAERESVESRLLSRVTEVEQQADAERREHARQLRWYGSMLLRRAGSMPLPAAPEEKAEAKRNEPPPQPSETAMAQAEVIVAEGKRLNAGREQIEAALRDLPGMTEEGVQTALNARVM